jgi:hypothetical protein
MALKIYIVDEKDVFVLVGAGLTSGVNYTYQYWVGETTPIANSPLVKRQIHILRWFYRLMMRYSSCNLS